MEFLIVLAVFLAVVVIVAAPLRRGPVVEAERRASAELADLEAVKEAKYQEIRDAEMDFRTGKLSREDWRALDRTLRAEAIQVLRRIDTVRAALAAPVPSADPVPERSDSPVG